MPLLQFTPMFVQKGRNLQALSVPARNEPSITKQGRAGATTVTWYSQSAQPAGLWWTKMIQIWTLWRFFGLVSPMSDLKHIHSVSFCFLSYRVEENVSAFELLTFHPIQILWWNNGVTANSVLWEDTATLTFGPRLFVVYMKSILQYGVQENMMRATPK